MVQRSAREEDSLVSQRMEYEKMLSQQRGLYGEKMSELEKLDSQRKVRPVVYSDKSRAGLTYLTLSKPQATGIYIRMPRASIRIIYGYNTRR